MTTNQYKKIEPFYCKPASRDEEIEIAKRLLLNAVSYDGWDSKEERLASVISEIGYKVIGIDVDGALTRWVDEADAPKNELTIHQVRSVFPYPHEEDKEYKQEFVPSVGMECEVLNQHIEDAKWESCRIDYIGNKTVVYTSVRHLERAEYISDIQLRPLKTEADAKREDAINQMIDCVNLGWQMDANIDCMKAHEMTCEQLYDAGYIKPEKIHHDERLKAAIAYSEKDPMEVRIYATCGFADGARWAEKHIKGEA